MEDKITILYVDDNDINRKLFYYNMRKFFNVITVESGKEGLEVIEKNHEICMIVSDMRMPVMNGVDFIYAVKKKHDIPCIIFSAYDIVPEIRQGIKEKKICKHMRKPINPIEMKNTIYQICG